MNCTLAPWARIAGKDLGQASIVGVAVRGVKRLKGDFEQHLVFCLYARPVLVLSQQNLRPVQQCSSRQVSMLLEMVCPNLSVNGD